MNLPERCYSYFLQEFVAYFSADKPFEQGVEDLKRLLRIDVANSRLQAISRDFGTDYDGFYDESPPEPSEPEGEIQVVSFDGKGVPTVKREAAEIMPDLPPTKAVTTAMQKEA